MTDQADLQGVFGAPPPELATVPAGATQFSPLVPDSRALEELPEGGLAGMVMLAPPGTVERRYAIALTLKALAPDARFIVLCPKDKGGTRLRKELEAFGCVVEEAAKRHHRICFTRRPETPSGLDEAIAEGGPRFLEGLGLWSQPGVFSWNRLDPGSAMLVDHLPEFAGRGADFGSGVGFLARAVLASPKVERLVLVDLDRRAVAASARNLDDPRLAFRQADLRRPDPELEGLDFVVTNPPFHDGGAEDRALGEAFIRRAHQALKPGGVLWLVANRHLPYEAALTPLFARVTKRAETGGYKVYEARR